MRGTPFGAPAGSVMTLAVTLALALSGTTFRCESGTAPRHHRVHWERLHGVIAFSRRQCASSCISELFVLDAAREEVREAARLPDAAFGSLAWIPDGRIGFDRLAGATPEVDAIALDGGLPVALFRPGAAPAWSRAGRAAYYCPPSHLCIDGAIVGAPALQSSATRPAWAPDGVHVVVAITDAQSHGALHVVDVRDGSFDPLQPADGAPAEGATLGDPAYSPDGTRIAFTRRPDSSGGTSEIWVMNADGSGAAALTRGEGDAAPSWSPDGRMLAFVRDGRAMLMNADGSDVEPLDDVDAGAGVVSVAWRPGWVAR